MVCIPCIVIPAVLWILHRFIYPVILFLFPNLKRRLCGETAAGPKDHVSFLFLQSNTFLLPLSFNSLSDMIKRLSLLEHNEVEFRLLNRLVNQSRRFRSSLRFRFDSNYCCIGVIWFRLIPCTIVYPKVKCIKKLKKITLNGKLSCH